MDAGALVLSPSCPSSPGLSVVELLLSGASGERVDVG